MTERALLVSVTTGSVEEAEASLEELARLADTAGATAVGSMLQRRPRLEAATLVGRGKVEELAGDAAADQVDLVIFDNELTPAQERNLSRALHRPVLDRTALILDIFAQHATSREGKVQVELAQLEYRLPRLRGRGVELSRLGGGIGTRGPGETQLEVDRRRIQARIAKLRQELDELGRTRRVKRAHRQRREVPVVALVGYTNAGKSSLLNSLTDAGALVEDQLFSTLDPTTRRLQLPSGRFVLVSDTVGFVRKLPHQLVEAFQSTLEEAAEADLLLHVVDVSAAHPEQQIAAVREVLGEIGASLVPELLVGNKADDADETSLARFRATHPEAVVASAVSGEGLDELTTKVGEALARLYRRVELLVPFSEGSLVARLHEVAEVLEEEYREDGTWMRVRLPVGELERSLEFVEPEPPTQAAQA
ncbi:MAG: GTPase HflX [Actinomycetota bacterium]|nr:GTPase HflX [Actinomycetota bacterium]